ncbi:MAG: DUF6089 family protein, partial [Bacteroidota bacterium]
MKKVFALFLFVATFISASAQFEVGISPGISFYTGDIAASTQLTSSGPVNFTIGTFARYQFHPNLAARINFAWANISGDDAKAQDRGRRNRNLSFNSQIFEVSLIGEVLFPPVEEIGYIPPFQAYVFGGIGWFHFNPKTDFQGESVELQPLGTEGQGLPGFPARYSLNELAIPVGIGAKFGIAPRLSLGIEYGIRVTFTDYLDDLSTVYVNPAELAAGNGALAAELAYRGDEIPGVEISNDVLTGRQRGNADFNDFYHISTVSLIY